MSKKKNGLGVPRPKKSGSGSPSKSSPKKAPGFPSDSSRAVELDDYYLQGEWVVFNPKPDTHKHISIHTDETVAVGVQTCLHLDTQSVALCGHKRNKAASFHAKLIADAGNTYRLTGMMPSEILKALRLLSTPKKRK